MEMYIIIILALLGTQQIINILTHIILLIAQFYKRLTKDGAILYSFNKNGCCGKRNENEGEKEKEEKRLNKRLNYG